MSSSATFCIQLQRVDDDRAPLLRALSVAAGGETIWPIASNSEESVQVPVDDLLSFLAEFWKPLLLRQTYPFALTPARPTALESAVSSRWEDAPQEQVDEEAGEFDAFEEAHNLSFAFGGLYDLPPLWLVRQGEHMLCDTGKILTRLPIGSVVAELTSVGDEVAELLMQVDGKKYEDLVNLWSKRDHAGDVSLVSWAASLESDIAAKLIGQGLIEPPKSFADAANDNDELLIAARVAGALPYDQIVEILEVARSFKLHKAKELDTLSEYVVEHWRSLGGIKPFAEGEALANFTREKLGIGFGQRVDIFALATQLGIDVRVDFVGPETFDGLAIAGERFGPGAFINRNSMRIRDRSGGDLSEDPGARINLAHEFCHFLVDRDHTLSAVEVLRSRMPASVEARARAFAGEFLLPSSTAARLWEEGGAPTDRDGLGDLLQRLADTFGVSFSVASWKLEHGARWGLGQAAGEDFRRLRSMLDILAFYR